MLEYIDIGQVLFLDIECVPQVAQYAELDPAWQALWARKAQGKFRERTEAQGAAAVYESAGLFAEFGRVICISVGVMQEGASNKLYIKSFVQPDEHDLLQAFAVFADELYNRRDEPAKGKRQIRYLCAHNGKEFDYPYLCRRMLVQQVRLPQLLHIQGKKPWEVPHLDTMELWKFGDGKAYTPLNLLAQLFGIPSPKDDIDGADIHRVYYEEGNLSRIQTYCQKDVVTVARLLQCMRYERPLADADVVMAP